MDALLGNDDVTAKKLFDKAQKMLNMGQSKSSSAAGAMMSSQSKPTDARDRLKASFSENSVAAATNLGSTNNNEDKPKRPKRPKPQNSKKGKK